MQKQKILLILVIALVTSVKSWADTGDIVFVTQPPLPADFATINSTFGNQSAALNNAPRGGDIYIRYADGTLRNLTFEAGLGHPGMQDGTAIAVRDPSVHWNGSKILFSMTVGAPSKRYETREYRWQLYEMTGLGKGETPKVTKVANQPTDYNNVMGTYATDDQILFVTDRPFNGAAHLYPQRDEYESTATNSGLWKLDPATGALILLDHAPSGDFHPTVDSFGRVIFTRWDHLQRDQQKDAGDYGTFDYSSEAVESVATSNQVEVYPEARSKNNADKKPFEELHTFNQFFPWMINEDGTEAETINHVGRHELGGYIAASRNDDKNLNYGGSGGTRTYSDSFLHLREDPKTPGRYYGVSAQEFGTHAAGQIIYLDGPPSKNPDSMRVTYVTHPDTRGTSDTPAVTHTGLYRNPLPLSSGGVVVSHTSSTQQDSNVGTSTQPASKYAFHLTTLAQSGSYLAASERLTPGIRKNISFWSPDELIQYNDTDFWELQPVELVARNRPVAAKQEIPAIEQEVFRNAGVDIPTFKEFMASRGLSLIVSRNVTTRDSGDKQQPFNLQIPGTSTKTIGASGAVYDIAFLQLFQGDLLRGYNGPDSPSAGRRVLSRPIHDLGIENPNAVAELAGAVSLGSDGSMAAFVPARRALSWQLTDPTGQGIVRERYWLTFQPGEVRVCASCHGVNTFDQSGHAAPTNPPEALSKLLAAFKSVPHEEAPLFQLDVLNKKSKKVARLTPGDPFFIQITGKNASASSRDVSLTVINGGCSNTSNVTTDSQGNKLISAKVPKATPRGKVTVKLVRNGSTVSTATVSVRPAKNARKARKVRCQSFIRP